MALIVEYHVVADMYAVNSTESISAGMLVSFAANGVVLTPTGQTATKQALGIAGDSSLNAEGQTTAYSAQLVIGADGAGTRWTENRVSDFYDETVASQKITVYNGGGKFHISEDIFDVPADIAGGELLRPSANTPGLFDDGATVASNDEIAIAVGANQAYDSGVPGTATTDGSMSLGNYIPIILRI